MTHSEPTERDSGTQITMVGGGSVFVTEPFHGVRARLDRSTQRFLGGDVVGYEADWTEDGVVLTDADSCEPVWVNARLALVATPWKRTPF